MTAPVFDRRFPDVTRLLVSALEVWVPDAGHTGPEVPLDLQDKLPFIRAYRIGGPRGGVTDLPVVSVDVFAGSYSAAEQLAENVDQWLCGPPPPIWQLDRVEPDVAPRRLPWGDERIYRFQAQYALMTRRVPITS